MSVDANVHGTGRRNVGQAAMRVTVQVPRAMGRVIPYTHSEVAEHDSLPAD
jgi:hypothetical protein